MKYSTLRCTIFDLTELNYNLSFFLIFLYGKCNLVFSFFALSFIHLNYYHSAFTCVCVKFTLKMRQIMKSPPELYGVLVN